MKLDPNLENLQRKGKKRGRKPSIKNLINNENTSDISKINDNLLSESGELESEVDQVTTNMRKIEKTAKKLSLLELTEKTCKWRWRPRNFRVWFCGHPSERENPIVKSCFYCFRCNNKKRKNKIKLITEIKL